MLCFVKNDDYVKNHQKDNSKQNDVIDGYNWFLCLLIQHQFFIVVSFSLYNYLIKDNMKSLSNSKSLYLINNT